MCRMSVTGVLLGVLGVGTAGAQSAPAPPSAAPPLSATGKPFTATLADLKPDKSQLLEQANQAKLQALSELRTVGGHAAARVGKLATLSTPKFLERMAVAPPVGPSAIATPRPGVTAPSPSVNWVGAAGGATVGHPGVALLLAKKDGSDTFNAYCTGTLIRQNIILTAAHCVCYSPDPSGNYTTGGLCLRGDSMTAPSALLDPTRWRVFFQHVGLRQIKRVEIDDQYAFGDSAVRNDLAIFVLSRPVSEINPPTMPAASDVAQAWASGLIVGFGFTANPNIPSASLLQQLVLPGLKAQGEVAPASCNTENYLDPNATICSIYSTAAGASQATICGGDSGGPLWQASAAQTSEIGVTSGRNNENCAAMNTLAFEMSIAYRAHSDWIASRVSQYGSPTANGRWPTFGQNLRYVVDKRNAQIFDEKGSYASEGWMTVDNSDPVLTTMNSSGRITHLELQDREGNTLCEGTAGDSKKMPNVDYCSALIQPGKQFHVLARGTPNEFLQYVVTAHAPGTSFAQ
jgi:hypothetical protein